MPMMAHLYGLGRPFWVVAMILGFILWWPLGLAALAFLYWSRKMGFCDSARADRWQRKMERMRERFERGGNWGWHGAAMRPSGNSAFDEYKIETLKRLEEEQTEFQDFLERLRHAKDKAEFDQFMAERRNRPTPPAPAPTQDA